jgi:hypothetical protein
MYLKKVFYLALITYNLSLLSGCTEDNIPREKAYPRFYFPKKEYKSFTSECGFSFELPTYTVIENKDSFRNQRLASDSCWFNIVYPDLNAKIHFSYKYYDDEIVASFINDSVIDRPNLKGLIYSVGGNAASDKQFILTDYKHQFIRGAIYFATTPNYDSLKPAINFIDKDIYHLINTFKF